MFIVSQHCFNRNLLAAVALLHFDTAMNRSTAFRCVLYWVESSRFAINRPVFLSRARCAFFMDSDRALALAFFFFCRKHSLVSEVDDTPMEQVATTWFQLGFAGRKSIARLRTDHNSTTASPSLSSTTSRAQCSSASKFWMRSCSFLVLRISSSLLISLFD